MARVRETVARGDAPLCDRAGTKDASPLRLAATRGDAPPGEREALGRPTREAGPLEHRARPSAPKPLDAASFVRSRGRRRDSSFFRSRRFERIKKIAEDAFEELCDWPKEPEKLPNGDWPMPFEGFVDENSDNDWDKCLLMCFKKQPEPLPPPCEADFEGEDEAAVAAPPRVQTHTTRERERERLGRHLRHP